MSRIGKKPIKINKDVNVEIVQGISTEFVDITVSGPLGSIKNSFKNILNIKKKEDFLVLEKKNETKKSREFHGLYRTLVNNMVEGVTKGFKKELEIVGIGYRAEMQGNKLVLSVGLSHKIEFVPPQGITIEVPEQTKIIISGVDKQKVGEVAAKIRSFRKPEPYKGKGIRYKGEKIRKKSTKSTT